MVNLARSEVAVITLLVMPAAWLIFVGLALPSPREEILFGKILVIITLGPSRLRRSCSSRSLSGQRSFPPPLSKI
ncbi:MAG: hypothetical protein WCF90_07190 [Methanomicrobiales archaeon]